MPKIDESRPFIPVRIAVLTVSDTRGPADDRSGDALVQMLESAGHLLAARTVVKDDVPEIRAKVQGWIAAFFDAHHVERAFVKRERKR